MVVPRVRRHRGLARLSAVRPSGNDVHPLRKRPISGASTGLRAARVLDERRVRYCPVAVHGTIL